MQRTITQWVKQILPPPLREGNEIQTRTAMLLKSMILRMVLAIVLFIGVTRLVNPTQFANLLFPAAVFPILIAVYYLMQRGYVKLASHLLILLAFLAMAIPALFNGGIHSPAYMGIFIVALSSGILINFKTAVFYASLQFVYGILLVVLESRGSLPASLLTQTAEGYLISHTIFMIAAMSILYLAIKDIVNNYRRAQKVEESFNHRKELLSKLVNQSKDGIFLTDEHGKVIEWNLAIERLTGISNEDVYDKPIWEVHENLSTNVSTQWSTYQDESTKLKSLFSTGQAQWLNELCEWQFTNNNGEAHTVQAAVFPLQVDEGNMLGAIIRNITANKSAEDALRMSETRFRTMAENIRDGITIIENGNVAFVNDRLSEITGYSREELMSIREIDLAAPDEKDRLHQLISKSTESGNTTHDLEYWMIRKDSERRFVYTRYSHICRENEAIRTIIVTTDITDRKLAQSALIAGEAHKDLVINSLPMVFYTSYPEGDYGGIWVSEQVNQISGFTAEEFTKNRELWVERIHPDDRSRVLTEFNSLEVKSSIELEYRWKTADDNYHWFQDNAVLVRDESENPIEIIGTWRDITERKQTERTSQMMQYAVDNSDNPTFWFDSNGKFMYVNEAACQILGYSHEELLDLSIPDIDPNFPSDSPHKAFEGLVDAGKVKAKSFHRHKDGTLIPVEIMAKYLEFEGQGYFFAQAVDITEREETERSLRRQLVELTTLHAVSTAGIETLNEDDLIQRITEIIGETFYPDHFGVMLLDDKSGSLIAHHSYQGISDNDRLKPVKLGKGVTGRVAATGKSLRINDTNEFDGYILMTPRMRSELCVPLSVNGRVIGVINAEGKKVNAFTEGDERLLFTVASQLATAIEKSRLLIDSQRMVKELESLYDASLATSKLLKPQDLLMRIYEEVHKLIDMDALDIILCLNDCEEIEIALAVEDGISKEEMIGTRMPTDEGGLVGLVIKDEKPLLFSDLCPDNLPTGIECETERLPKSWLGVPLIAGDKIVGAISVQSFQPRAFNEGQLKYLEQLGAQIAIALENARLYQIEQRRRLEAEAHFDASAALTTSIELEQVLENILLSLEKVVRYDSASIQLVENGHVRIVGGRGFKSQEEVVGFKVPKNDKLFQTLVRTKRPIILENAQNNPEFNCWADIDYVRGWMGIPLIDQGKVFGVLTLDSKHVAEYSNDDAERARIFANQAASAIIKARHFAEARRRIKYLQALHSIDQLIIGSLDLNTILERLLAETVTHLEVDAGAILLYRPTMQVLEYATSFGFNTKALQHTRLHLGRGYAGRAVIERRVLKVNLPTETDSPFEASQHFKEEGFQTYIGVPLIAKGVVKGVLELFHRGPINKDQEWMDFLDTLAIQAAIAMENAELVDSLHRAHSEMILAYDLTLEGWAQALELRDKEIEGHSQRVIEMTMKLAYELGIRDNELSHIRRGALLHDIGKMGIPDSILLKPGPLNDEEWEIMRKHPEYAYNLLHRIPFLEPALSIPYSHHEKWDGSGYPQGLKGEEIPLAARIFAVVDAFDAICSNRPYRDAQSSEEAIKIIKKDAGSHFDPTVVEAFLRLVRKDRDFINVYTA